MRQFIASMLGALAALVVFTGTAAVLFVVFLVVIASLNHRTQNVPDGGFLVLDLSANITDAPPTFNLSQFTGEKNGVIQLREAIQAIRAAAHDSRIKGILLEGSLDPAGYGSGYAALKELRDALGGFRAAGKPVRAFLTNASTRDYYLASVASEVDMDPYGLIVMPGLASQPMFFAGAMQKYGVGVQVTRVGKYKSAVEPFTRTDMSPENREETQRLLNDIWGNLTSEISASRKLTPGALQAVVDRDGIMRADEARQAGLVDRLEYRDELIDALKKETGADADARSFKQISLARYATVAKPPQAEGNPQGKYGRVAVVYAEGMIVDGDGQSGQVGGDALARELRKLRLNDQVKAVVLRVNSPGGSASAAEEIQREMRLIQKEKPLVVSMGSYAASGGYWISTFSDRIFAEPNTITGSIGVFGMQFNVQQLANDFGITFDSVKTGRFADALSITRPKTPEELAVLQRLVDWIYGQFVGKVAEGRKLDPAFVQNIAQGRVWSGAEAVKLGLVDQLGGLQDAVAYAAKRADLRPGYGVSEYPRRKPLGEQLADLMKKFDNSGASSSVDRLVSRRFSQALQFLRGFNDPQGVYAIMPSGAAVQ